MATTALARSAQADQKQLEPVPAPVTPSRIPRPPLAEPRPFVEHLHGMDISDPYRWMETPEEAALWSEAQQVYAGQVLTEAAGQDRLMDALTGEFESLPTLEDVIPIPGGVIFDRWLAEGQTWRLAPIDGVERALFDPVLLAAAGRSSRVRAITASWDGRYVAVTATGDGDAGVQVSVVEVETGRLSPDFIPDMLTTTTGARYQVAWLPDSSGFVYPRLAAGALEGPAVDRLGRGRQTLHRLGAVTSEDVDVFGFGVDPNNNFDPDDLPAAVVTAPESDWIVATASRVRANVAELWAARLSDPQAGRRAWRRIAASGFRQARLSGDRVYALTEQDADRGRIVSLDLADDASDWRTEIAERAGVLRSFEIASDALYFAEYRDGVVQLARRRHGSETIEPLAAPLSGDARFAMQDPTRDTPWIKTQCWVTPAQWFRALPDATAIVPGGLEAGGSAVDRSGLVSRHILVEVDDGVRVPVSIVHPRGLALDGRACLLFEAYGGYGDIQSPSYNPSIAVWVRQRAVYAYAHVRGGGELGAAWRSAAVRERKIRSSQDVVAVARGLIALGYASAGRIAVVGTSSGAQMPGLAAIAEPSLFGAAVFDVGQPHEIRGAQLDPTAARNLAEMGDLDTAEGVRLLMQVSPYHRVPAAVDLPGFIVRSGANDYNFGGAATDAKYVARLQAANTGDRPVVWMTGDAGHDSVFGMDPIVSTQVMAFMLWQTGHPDFQPG